MLIRSAWQLLSCYVTQFPVLMCMHRIAAALFLYLPLSAATVTLTDGVAAKFVLVLSRTRSFSLPFKSTSLNTLRSVRQPFALRTPAATIRITDTGYEGDVFRSP
jgi:hypothetical protein